MKGIGGVAGVSPAQGEGAYFAQFFGKNIMLSVIALRKSRLCPPATRIRGRHRKIMHVIGRRANRLPQR